MSSQIESDEYGWPQVSTAESSLDTNTRDNPGITDHRGEITLEIYDGC